MNLSLLQTRTHWIITALIIIVAVILRLYQLPGSITFQDDQGLDMLVIRQMEFAGHRPLVGPYLSVDQVYTPPTYYYLTWALYHFTHSVEGIVYGYAAMNILTLLLLMKLAFDLAGRRAAWITGEAFAVSSLMIQHSRTFWQPYPMQMFIALSLLSFLHAFRKKHIGLLWLALLMYQVALSVYPSPMLILPYVLYQLIRWYRTAGACSILRSYIYGACTFILTFVIVFLPHIIYEITHNFPTIRVYAANPYASVTANFVLTRIGENLTTLSNSYTSIGWLFPDAAAYLIFLVGIIITFLMNKQRITHGIRSFIAPWMLLCGVGVLFFHTNDVFEHRSWSYLPFLFLITGIVLDRALRNGGIQKLLAVYLLVLYTILNLGHASHLYSENAPNNIRQIRAIADFIRNDMSSRHITQYTTVFLHTFPGNDINYLDKVFRIFYWLTESDTISLSLTAPGNNLTLDRFANEQKPNLYIVCFQFLMYEEAIDTCVKKHIVFPEYTIANQTTIGSAWVFALTQQAPPQPAPHN